MRKTQKAAPGQGAAKKTNTTSTRVYHRRRSFLTRFDPTLRHAVRALFERAFVKQGAHPVNIVLASEILALVQIAGVRSNDKREDYKSILTVIRHERHDAEVFAASIVAKGGAR